MSRGNIVIKRPRAALIVSAAALLFCAVIDALALSRISFLPDYYAAYSLVCAGLSAVFYFVVINFRTRSKKSYIALICVFFAAAYTVFSFVYNLITLSALDIFLYKYMPWIIEILAKYGVYF
ncbi:MAG: hypothetical protein LBP79_05295 [Clostridiales bacterium]|nr:hypothetical protein [Clostridiales bacterium]